MEFWKDFGIEWQSPQETARAFDEVGLVVGHLLLGNPQQLGHLLIRFPCHQQQFDALELSPVSFAFPLFNLGAERFTKSRLLELALFIASCMSAGTLVAPGDLIIGSQRAARSRPTGADQSGASSRLAKLIG